MALCAHMLCVCVHACIHVCVCVGVSECEGLRGVRS